MELKPIFDAIRKANSIVISGHVNGDADSIGACFAMAYCLKSLGKKPIVLLEDYSEKYKILPGFEFVYKGSIDNLSPDLFIALDCGEDFRLGKNLKLFNSTKNIVIDHHINPHYGNYNYIDTSASSTCELVYGIITQLGEIDINIAQCLYAGIVTDTGGFRFKSVSSKTMEITSKLLKYDFPFSIIYEKLMYQQTLNQFNGFINIVSNFVVVPEIKLVYSIATNEKMKQLGVSRGDLDGVPIFLKRIKTIDIAIFAYEINDGKTKISMRSTESDINVIARYFGGGGHKHASGIVMDFPPKVCIEKIVSHIKGI